MSLRLVLALAWFIAFCVWFMSFGIPNGGPVSRWMVWTVLPFDLLDVFDPPFDPAAAPWSWLFLAQRVPFLLTAGLIWLGAWGAGSLVLRGLGLREAFDPAERLFFAGCLGLSGVSLAMLGLGLMGLMNRWPLVVLLLAAPLAEMIWKRRERPSTGGNVVTAGATGSIPMLTVLFRSHPNTEEHGRPQAAARGTPIIEWTMLLAVAPFVVCLLLGAMSPQTDFDVVEYHLGGPKEWFQQGRIARLPHNVYTSFPFLTEMLLLCGMVLFGDWDWGALAGQAALAGFAPLTALGLYATGRRWFGSTVGCFAALVWLTAPWAYRISIIAYAEGGLACYLFAALAVGLRIVWGEGDRSQETGDRKQEAGLVVLCGLLAGSAMACKYTGAVSVVLPLAVMIAIHAAQHSEPWTVRVRRGLLLLALFGAGVFLTVGPWLVKNAVETGNPVYPLAYSVFGGEGRDVALDAKWRAAHGAKTYSSLGSRLSDLIVKLTDVTANNDWHSPLMFGLAPLALLASWRKRVWTVWAFIGWQFLSWFWLTHHIDRFYVPMLPVVALLAGAGAAWLWSTRAGRWCGGALIAAGLLYNAWVMKELGGFNAGRLDLRAARDIAVTPAIRWLNAEGDSGRLSPDTKVLCVGEAGLFHARFRYAYNTVFDRSLFEDWFFAPAANGDLSVRPVDDIRATLRSHGITHVLVNWSEILRYREPGSYGYTDAAHPDRVEELIRLGLLKPVPLPPAVALQPLTESRLRQVETWAPSLGTTVDGQPALNAVQLFECQQP